MALAVVSAETFWGNYLLVLGSVVVLFSLVVSGMPPAWTRWLTGIGAIALALGAAFSAGSVILGYGKTHHTQEHLAIGGIIVAAVGLVSCLVCGKRVSRKKGN